MAKKKGPQYFYDIIQNTYEWFIKRLGHFSASTATTFNPKGVGKGLKTLIDRKAKEIVFGPSDKPDFTSESAEHGHYYEDVCRQKFSEVTGFKIIEVGYIEESPYAGISPDGYLPDTEIPLGLEIKCYQKEHHEKVVDKLDAGILKGLSNNECMKKADKGIYSQIQYSLMISGLEGWWFACYHPGLEEVEEAKQFRFIYISRDEYWIGYYRSKLEVAIDLLKEEVQRLSGGNKEECEQDILFDDWSD